MRRLVVLPVKTTAIAAILLAGTIYVAAEARQAVLKHQEFELAGLEHNLESTPVAKNRVITGQTTNSPAKPHMASSSQPERKVHASAASQSIGNASASDEHRREIIISIPDRRLALLEDGKLIRTYPIAVGTRWTPSPEGEFTIINHAVNPVYRHKGKEILPGKNNPLGDRWMGLSLKGYGIHGTNVPSSIGKAASHGCLRMARSDVEDLYNRVKVGDRVIIRRERDELIAKIFAPAAAPATGGAGTEDQTQSASISSTEYATATAAIVQQ
ncbi:MAG: L,D-transpeptidase [Actinomycetota bacterium]